MAYTPFENGKPSSADNGDDVVADVEKNLAALRDAVAIGSMPGWNYSKLNGSGSAEKPQYVYFSNGTNKIRGTLTWTGDDVTKMVWEFSTDSGSTYPDIMGTLNIVYDGNDNVVSEEWS